jgi:hypothetical protein
VVNTGAACRRAMPLPFRPLPPLALVLALVGLTLPAAARAETPDPVPSDSQGIGPEAIAQDPGPPAAPATPAPAAAPGNPWAATVELYGFAPIRTTSTIAINGVEASSDVSLAEVLRVLKAVGYVRATLEKGRLGLLTDLSYVRVGGQAARTGPRGLLTGSASVNQSQGIYDIALRYRFGDREAAIGQPGQFSIIPYAGIRIVNLGLGLDVEVAGNGPFGVSKVRQGDYGRTWVQPLIGTEATVFVSPRLRAFARGDLGGFGLAGSQDISGNGQVGLGYAIGNNTDLNVSFRYLGLNYNNGAARSSGYVTSQTGFQVGVKFFF